MIKNVNGVEVEMSDAEVAEYNALQVATAEEVTQMIVIQARTDRDSLLTKEVDPVVSNPLRWANLTAAKQAEWTQYRTDLLNVPNQSGFPNSITWPTKP